MTAPTRSQLKKNLTVLRKRLDISPMDLDARMRMARTHRLLGERKKSVAHYRAVARYLSLSARPLQAIAVLKELLQVDPKHEETLLFLAKLYARTRAVDVTNRGRVAVPILDGDQDRPIALPEGMPLSATGIWRSIRPQATDIYAVVHEPDEVDAVNIADELRELEQTVELDDLDVLEASPERGSRAGDDDDADDDDDDDDDEWDDEDDIFPIRTSPAPVEFDVGPDSATRAPVADASIEDRDQTTKRDLEISDPLANIPDIEGFDIIGPVATEDVVLPQVPLFSTLPPAAFIDLGHSMLFRRARAGELIFKEGDPGDSCIVIARGGATATRRLDDGSEVTLMTLGEGDFAGIFALMSAQERHADLRADTDVEYFEIDSLAIGSLVDKHPQVEASLSRYFRDRLLLNVLALLPGFAQLDEGGRLVTVTRFTDRTYNDGDELFFEGATDNGVWVLLEGHAVLSREAPTTPGKKKPHAKQPPTREPVRLHAGDFLGNLAGFESGAADMNAHAEGRAVTAQLSHSDLDALVDEHPALRDLRGSIADAGLMMSDHVFAGNGRMPGGVPALPASRFTDRR